MTSMPVIFDIQLYYTDTPILNTYESRLILMKLLNEIGFLMLCLNCFLMIFYYLPIIIVNVILIILNNYPIVIAACLMPLCTVIKF